MVIYNRRNLLICKLFYSLSFINGYYSHLDDDYINIHKAREIKCKQTLLVNCTLMFKI